MKLRFDMRCEGDASDAPFLDAAALEQMFDSERRAIGDGLRRKFHGVVCPQHEQEPSFLIRGLYSREEETMDIQYHVDACCQSFLLRVMQLLNQRA